MIAELTKKAHYYALLIPHGGGCTTASKRKHEEESEKAVSKKRKIINRNRQLRVQDFPQRLNNTLRYKRVRATTGQKRIACVMCSTKFEDNLKRYKCKLIDTAPDWDKDVNRPYTFCSACSTDRVRCFLCNKCDDEFHTAP